MTLNQYLKKYLKSGIFIATTGLLAIYCAHVAGLYKEFRHGLKAFHTVKLTDQRTDVIYRLGRPTSVIDPIEIDIQVPGSWQRVFTVDTAEGDINAMPPGKKIEDYDEWVYEKASGPSRLTVAFDKAGHVTSLKWYCDSEESNGWGPVAGIRHGDKEEKVLSLGTPSINEIEDSTKTIAFSDIGLEFRLAKGRTYMVILRHPIKGEMSFFIRFIHSLY